MRYTGVRTTVAADFSRKKIVTAPLQIAQNSPGKRYIFEIGYPVMDFAHVNRNAIIKKICVLPIDK